MTKRFAYDDLVGEYVYQYWSVNFHAPNCRQIQRACGIKSTSTAASVARRVMAQCGGRYTNGKAIPGWVIAAINKARDEWTPE